MILVKVLEVNMQKDTNIVLLGPDVAKVFKTPLL